MEQAKLKVLELLGEGKVTAAEAVELLEALQGRPERFFVGFDSFDEDEKEDLECARFEEKLREFGEGVENLARECGHKVEDVYYDLEPKLKKVGYKLLSKMAAVVEDLAQVLNETIERENEEKQKTSASESGDATSTENS